MKTNAITKTFSKIKIGVNKHSPEILIISGIAGLIGAGALACMATLKSQKIMEERKSKLNDVKLLEDEKSEEYSIEEANRDRFIINVQTGLKIAGQYAPIAGIAILSTVSILTGHNILRKRAAAIAAAYATVSNGFEQYRKRVIERFGEKVDEELKLGTVQKQITKTEIDEGSGKEKKIKSVVDVADKSLGGSPYSFIYDCTTAPSVIRSNDDNEYVMLRLRSEQAYANDLLNARGYVTLNEILERLGLRTCKMGQIVGWSTREGGDGFVDFGAREMLMSGVDSDEYKIILDFNCQGNILDLI